MSTMFATESSPSSSARPSAISRTSVRVALANAFGLSHRGLVRPDNEDAFLIAQDLCLYAVADGMGGAAAGEVASRLAIDAVRAVFHDPDATCPTGVDPNSVATDLPLLVAGVERANAQVHAMAKADSSKAGMGTTFTGLLLLKGHAAIAHVGDSRAYRLRNGGLELLTHDHTLVDELVRTGTMSHEDAERSTIRHILSRAVGTHPTVEVDSRFVAIEPGDTFLLCSDGLHGVVGDDDIRATLLSAGDLTRAAAQLIEAANDAGAPDNVTVVLVRVGDPVA
ncbi:Protein serine/threonine phosphatase PrpC, regulation of stationary phase [Minicystis rosea]|nr:Protein serine/threonine phosphatase PrpC, regulation of stationary phase [Minicystis rosea]